MGVMICTAKVVAASATVFSTAVALRLATPVVTEFLAALGPRLYESVSAWLTPPYLYFIINGIIISIAATSHFQKPVTTSDDLAPHPTPSSLQPTISAYANPNTTDYISKFAGDSRLRPEFHAPAICTDVVMGLPVSSMETDLEEDFKVLRSSWSPRRVSNQNQPENLAAAGAGAIKEKPRVSPRLVRRRSIKASPEGKSLGVARPKKYETLESTWKTITDGRHVPLGRHLKKSDTWGTRVRAPTADPSPPPPPPMLKSDTFPPCSVAAASLPSPPSPSGNSMLRRESSGGKLRRESSLGQDELNRRVEAFIKKFNEEMRLQRQNSLQQYMEAINGSSH